MSDHYSILGLTKSATNAEIKAAYRRLVKIYHPDKNPDNPVAVEKFRAIQEAYDVLSHALSRTRYDNRFSSAAYSYESPFSQTAQKKEQGRTKKYTFTEEDLKRRQYYKEHYKQHNPRPKVNSEEQKKNFNEIKYMLISVPVAIALLFFIINIYNRGKEVEKVVNTSMADSTMKKVQEYIEKQDKEKADSLALNAPIVTSAEPYKELFGSAKVDKRTLQVVQVTNWANRDAVVCVVDAKTNKVVRHYFIQDNFNLYFEFLPEGTYYLRNYLGSVGSFTKDKKKQDGSSVGMFTEKEQFQEYAKDTFTISLSKHDTIAKNILFIKDDKQKNLIEPERFFGL